MSLFYKMDPAKWDFGTADLSLEAEAAYLRIVNAIHKHDGPVPNNDRVLAGLFRSSTRKARALLCELLDAGKVTIEDGFIWNERARSDLVHRGFTTISASERGAKGGRKRAENAAKVLENNNTDQAIASTRIEENRIDKSSVSKDTAATAAKDPAKVMFDSGISLLGVAGIPATKARSIIGKWKADHGAESVLVALGKAQREGAIDPVAFCQGVFRQDKKTKAPTIGEQRKNQHGETIEWGGDNAGWVKVWG